MSDKPDPGKNYASHPDYEKLPQCIKILYTEKEYAWLPESEKQNIIQDNTMPETYND